MSIAREHAEWLSLMEVSGPFVSVSELTRVFPQGLDAADPALMGELRRAHDEWEESQAASRPDPALHTAWLRFTLERILALPPDLLLAGPALAPHLRVTVAEHGETLAPDLALVNPADRGADARRVRLVVQRYSAGQDLERAIPGARWNASPAARMAALLRGAEVTLGLVTNGEQWMLVNALPGLTTGYASWYATLWQEEPLTLRAFQSLLAASRFFGVADDATLTALIAASAANQYEVTDQLGYQVRRAVEVLIQAIDRVDKDRGRALLAGRRPEDLYDAALTVMMRLVFLFCAEERGLLLLGEDMYDDNYAVSPLGAQLRATADQHGEEVLERATDAWARLLATFRAVFAGVQHEAMRLPAYGGRLFDPDRYPFLEGRPAGSAWRETPADQPLVIDNRTVLHLLEALQLLQARLPGGGPVEAQRVSFRALDIEQIGHVYEGLLDHTARRAEAPVLGLEGKRDVVTEVALAQLETLRAKDEVALIEYLKAHTGRTPNALRKALATRLDADEQARLLAACDNDDALCARALPFATLLRLDDFAEYPVVYSTGSVYVTVGADRRSSGTHYTPRALTEPIVQYTLEPLCYVGPSEGRPRDGWVLRPARELLALKICDPAMGSGAFLVSAARYLAERLLEAWDWTERQARLDGRPTPAITPEGEPSQGNPAETLIPADEHERRILALRLICDRCLYGVDKNPMAVEMARLSLWLTTLAKGRPFTFLDHALRCGDSLLGVGEISQLKQWNLTPASDTATRQTSWIEPVITHAVADALRLRRAIEAHPVATVADLEEKAGLLFHAERAMELVKLGADLLVGAALAPDAKERARLRQDMLAWYQVVMSTQEHQDAERRRGARIADTERDAAAADLARLRARADELLGGRCPFHWPLEFPEVFVVELRASDSLNDGHTSAPSEWALYPPGFSAIVSNPPFMGGQKITAPLGEDYRNYLITNVANEQRGSADLCAYFFLRAGLLLQEGGDAGMLATNTIAQGDTREVGLDQLVAAGGAIPRAIPSRPWPGDAALEVATVWLRRGPWDGAYTLDDHPVAGITPYLTAPGALDGNPYRLLANADRSFQGSIVLGMGFVLEPEEAQSLIARDPRNRDVLFPYLNGEDLNSRPDQSPSRWVINFHDWPLTRAETYPDCMAIVREKVKPERDRQNDQYGRDHWWQFLRTRPELYATIADMPRVLVRARVSNINSIAFVPAGIICSEATVVFASDQYSLFALLQAMSHTEWLTFYASSMRTDVRYTPSDCFETFPFPDDLSGLEDIGERYYQQRQAIMLARQEGLTKTYNRFHNPFEAAPDIAQLRRLHVAMDEAVARAYGWGDLALDHDFHTTKQGLRYTISAAARHAVLGRLLALNHARHAEELAAGLVDAKGKVTTAGRARGKGRANGQGKRGGPPATEAEAQAAGRGLWG